MSVHTRNLQKRTYRNRNDLVKFLKNCFLSSKQIIKLSLKHYKLLNPAWEPILVASSLPQENNPFPFKTNVSFGQLALTQTGFVKDF